MFPLLPSKEPWIGCEIRGTDVLAYSDTLGTWEKCLCIQIVTVNRGSLVTNQSFGTCSKCHCKWGVTVNSVTVTGDICTVILHLVHVTFLAADFIKVCSPKARFYRGQEFFRLNPISVLASNYRNLVIGLSVSNLW